MVAAGTALRFVSSLDQSVILDSLASWEVDASDSALTCMFAGKALLDVTGIEPT
jgi:hypothetical protein